MTIAEAHTASQPTEMTTTMGPRIHGYVLDSLYTLSRNPVPDITLTQVDHIRRDSEKESPIRIHNFAFPGATAEDDLSIQFSRFKMGLRDAPLNGKNTSYCA